MTQTQKQRPALKLPFLKGEKIIQISASTSDSKNAGNFRCLTNKGRVFNCYGAYDNSTVPFYVGYKYELIIGKEQQ